MINKLTIYVHYISMLLGISLADIELIMSIVCFGISIIAAVVGIILKYSVYKKNDGKIDHQEMQDLLNEIDNLKKELKNNGKQN